MPAEQRSPIVGFGSGKERSRNPSQMLPKTPSESSRRVAQVRPSKRGEKLSSRENAGVRAARGRGAGVNVIKPALLATATEPSADDDYMHEARRRDGRRS